ncbi:MFS transporter [Mycobacterium sp. 852002-51057_SCH5723018]|uniref:MFS transporter n=1 Tax=Mycobacterium sp. 852002-51057_SCH5723018 TaxID=1834094 RepID=UPI001E4052C3|nr:MFS transporter [Mycobacterium sp. 852002-51057_SCH5723018]
MLAVIGVAQLMVVLDTTIVNIALPSAQAALHFGTESRQWIITAYSLSFGSLLLLGGRLSDIVGRRRTLLVGLLGFAFASAVGGASSGFAMLAIARALQGVFAAVLAPAALSTLNVTFTDAKQRGKALAVYGAIAGGGAVVGLLLGGALTEWLSWRWCLYVNLIFAIVAAAGVLVFVAARDDRGSVVRLDWPGVITGSAGLFCLVYGLSNAETDSWSAPLTIVMFIGSGLLLVAFGVIETRAAAPLLPLRIVMDRNRVGAYLAIMIAFCSMFSAFLFLTYYAQQNLGYSPLRTGVAFLPLAGGVAVAAAVANARLIPKLGPRRVVPPGMLIAAFGMFLLAHLDIHSTYAGNVLGPLLLLGVGMGLTFAPAIATATAGVTDADAGVASAMVNTSQQIGGAIGTAALSTIFASALSHYMTSHRSPSPALRAAAAIHGYTVAFGVSCALFVAGAGVTTLLLRGTPVGDESDESGRPKSAAPGATARIIPRQILDLKRQIARLEAENHYLANELRSRRPKERPKTQPRPASHPRRAKPIALGPSLFGIVAGIAVILVAIMAATSHRSHSYDEVVRSCVAKTKAQVEHYRPGALNQLANLRDCESVNRR